MNKEVGQRIKLARQEAGLTQKELAEKLKFAPKHLSNIECGFSGISLSLLMKISEATNKSLDFLTDID